MKLLLISGMAAIACATACTVPRLPSWPAPPTPQQRFDQHVAAQLGAAVPTTVSQVYYFADGLGADSTYQLGFTTDAATLATLVIQLGLAPGQPDFGVEGIARDLPWWNREHLAQATPYWKTTTAADYYWLLWYHPPSQRAYWLEFGL